jgi:hypothetical protein
MPDKKVPDKDPLPPDKAPMKDPPIEVKVQPKDAGTKDQRRENHQYADKVRKRLSEDVKKSVDTAGNDAERRDSPNPRKDQLDAAKKTVDDASRQIDPNKIERVKVKVDGETVKEGPPGEGGAPQGPPPPPKKP